MHRFLFGNESDTSISLKKTKIKSSMVVPLIFVVAVFANFLFTQPLLTFGVLTALYTLSIPFGVWRFLRDKRLYREYQKATGDIE